MTRSGNTHGTNFLRLVAKPSERLRSSPSERSVCRAYSHVDPAAVTHSAHCGRMLRRRVASLPLRPNVAEARPLLAAALQQQLAVIPATSFSQRGVSCSFTTCGLLGAYSRGFAARGADNVALGIAPYAHLNPAAALVLRQLHSSTHLLHAQEVSTRDSSAASAASREVHTKVALPGDEASRQARALCGSSAVGQSEDVVLKY